MNAPIHAPHPCLNRLLARQHGHLPGRINTGKAPTARSSRAAAVQSKAEHIPSFTLLWIYTFMKASPAALLPLLALPRAGFRGLVCFQTTGS